MNRRKLPQPEPVAPGEESVWEYPRPPALEVSSMPVRVELAGVVIASSATSLRVLETSHPPAHYVPADGIQWRYFSPAVGSSYCEWKGSATYWTVTCGTVRVEARAWSYESPTTRFADLAGYVSFYPSFFDCYVGEELVAAQPGEFYGGWITRNIKGPFKGAPGSLWW